MSNPLLLKNQTAEAALAARRIVKPGTADNTVIQGAAVGDALLGVLDQPKGAAIDDRCDVLVAGIADVEAGGAITRGDLLTTNATGQAVAAAPAAGVNNSVIGRAMISGVAGDIIQALLAPGQIQGA